MIPKVELHVHLEFTATPALIKRLATRHNIQLPETLFVNNEQFAWTNFAEFLDIHEYISRVIRTPEDYRDITFDYLVQSAKEGVIYTELLPSPDHAALWGMSYQDLLAGIAQGIHEAHSQTGIDAKIIIGAVRHFGVEKVNRIAELAAHNPHPLVVGFGLGGDEAGYPPGQFAKAYRIAHEAGLGTTVHAGEMVGAEGIREALHTLPVTRLGHGIRIIEDTQLMQEVIDRSITLECCPTSNIKLNVYRDYASHPLQKLKAAGIKITLNSDDPPYFDTTIGKEYDIAKTHFRFSDADLYAVSETAIHASFADTNTKQKLLQRIHAAKEKTHT